MLNNLVVGQAGYDGAVPASSTGPLTLPELQAQFERLRAEFYLEKRFRTEFQRLAAVNAESIRRLQRSLLVSARDLRDAQARLSEQQQNLEKRITDLALKPGLSEQIDEIQQDLELVQNDVKEMQISPALLMFHENQQGNNNGATFNLTQTVNSIAQSRK